MEILWYIYTYINFQDLCIYVYVYVDSMVDIHIYYGYIMGYIYTHMDNYGYILGF